MTSTELRELTESILKSVVEGTYNYKEIISLVNKALEQEDSIERLQGDVERLTQAVIDAGEHITKLESKNND